MQRLDQKDLAEGIDKRVLTRGYIGLAISGGGIRSATFALGILQALAKEDLLKYFDYMSTVSGGGYIGGALTWALRRSGGGGVNGLGPNDFPFGTAEPRDRQDCRNWKGLLRYLREHGEYLKPGEGITLLSGLAVVLRGILLNFIVVFPLLTAIFLLALPFSTVLNWAAVALFVLFIVICVIYSIGTGLSREITPPWLSRYAVRRLFESRAKFLLPLSAFLLVLGTLPFVVDEVEEWLLSSGAASLLAGMLGVGSKFSSVKSKMPDIIAPLIAPLAAALFLYGLAVLACWAALELDEPENLWLRPYYLFALLVAPVTAVWVNLNYISLHRFYRDRLMETFLPDQASVDQQSTGPAKGADSGRLSDMWNPGGAMPSDGEGGPYHIINTNLILVDSKDRRRRIRGGDNFILSPFFCGSSATDYVRTSEFMNNGMTLSTAVAISGAAVNPSTGVGGVGLARNRLVGWLLALLNIRLGYWAPNPQWLIDGRHKRYKRSPNHITSFLYEVSLGGFRESHKWLQLSDGGHFENLALYELIRRRTRLIVVSDAGADPDYAFADLCNAILRVGEDFKAKITFGPVFWRENPGTPSNPEYISNLIPTCARPARFPHDAYLAALGHVIGTIDYGKDAFGRHDHGIIIIIKSTPVDHLSLETRGYWKQQPSFPDQTTADQFFDEQQFEAYRDLGFKIATDMIARTKLERLMATIR